MKGMACKLLSPFKSHPFIACSVLLLFTPPIFPMLMFFWPLIVSTALGVLAVISFGQQAEDTASVTGVDHVESAVRSDEAAFPAQAETISNVLMVGNQEVTWLEWLHNEDTQKVHTQECEHAMPAVWDADGYDVSFAASEATVDATASRIEAISNVYACGPTAEDETCVSARVLTVENEIRATARTTEDESCVSALVLTVEREIRATSPTVASWDGIRVNNIALMESNQEDTKKNTLSFIAEDETKSNALDTTAEDAEWDAVGCDLSSAASEAIVDAIALRGMGNVHACRPIAEDETCVSVPVFTVENEITASVCTVAGVDGIRVNDSALIESNEEDTQKNALSFIAENASKRNALDTTAEDELNANGLSSTVKDDENVDMTNSNAHSLTAEDEMKAGACHTTAEDETKHICCDVRNAAGTYCRTALDSSAKYDTAEDMGKRNVLDLLVKKEIDVSAPACVDGVEGQIRIDGVGLSGESKSMVSAFESGIGNAHTTPVSSLGLTIDDKSKMNDCTSASGEGKTRPYALFSTSKVKSREDATELSSSNVTVSVVLESKAVEGHGIQHIDDEQDQEEIDTRAPEWDASDDDEENKSSLRFSFFDNGCIIAMPVKHECQECDR